MPASVDFLVADTMERQLKRTTATFLDLTLPNHKCIIYQSTKLGTFNRKRTSILDKVIGLGRQSKLSRYFFFHLSCYAGALLTDLPYANLEYYDENTETVKNLNKHIDGNEFMAILGQKGRKVYHLIDVSIYFDQPCQERLKYFVPVIRKGVLGKNDLSPRVRELIESLGLHVDTKTPVNLQDFQEQRQSLSYPYLELLLSLGVKVRAVHSLATALAFPIFRRIISKFLHLKKMADNDFEKGWFKLMCNGS